MDVAELIRRYPRLYHMAVPGAWPSIRRHGLLSTTAILDRLQMAAPDRCRLERAQRADGVDLVSAAHGRFRLRDQKPIPEA